MDGADDALTELVRERGAALLKYASLLVGERRGAEDLVQDALVKVFARQRSRAADLESIEAYVRRTILTLFLDSYRRHVRWTKVRHLFAEPGEASGLEDRTGDRVDVAGALKVLTPRERACVVLRFYLDMTVPQIADELGIAQGTVKRYLSDANTALAERLAPATTGEATTP